MNQKIALIEKVLWKLVFVEILFIPLFTHFVAYSDGSLGPVGVYTREDC
jgi:hypothetical protein